VIWDRVLGHQEQAEMFRRAIRRERLAHGYLLVGPAGIGKQLFARTLAQCLFCERIPDAELDACGDCPSCRQMQAGNHPDLISIGLPEGKKSIPISLIVGDREERGQSGLCYEIALAPMSASRRIAIIDDAETMLDDAANSLLKTLEEPRPGSIIFLISSDLDLILPTIRSRCQPVRFSPLRDEHVLELLKKETGSTEGLEEIVNMAEGSLEVARQLQEEGMRTLWKTVSTLLSGNSLDSRTAVTRVQTALEELRGDTATQRVQMGWIVRFAIETLRRRMSQTSDVDQLDRIGTLLDRCFEAEQHLKQTMPIPLCLESLFTELARRSRAS
jgi:DNA polymerase-3 subunit delta'